MYWRKLSVGLFLATSLATALAYGAEVERLVPPTTGHPLFAAEMADFSLFDNTVCGESTDRDYVWMTPLVTDWGHRELRVWQHTNNDGWTTEAASAVWTFDRYGNYYSWSGSYTTQEYIGAVYLPISGNAFIRSNLRGNCEDFGWDTCLHTFRVRTND